MMEAFWCYSPLTIQQAMERLQGEFRFLSAEYDYENVYEWFEVTSPDGLRLNVSRKHRDGEPDFADPVRISASAYQSADSLGDRLAICLGTTVYYGQVTYLGGDEFSYNEASRFEPSEQHN